MKIFKKTTSLLLCIVMLVSMFSMGMTSLASVVSSKLSVTAEVKVPELIYLTPGSTTFQYYIEGVSAGAAPDAAKKSQGSISMVLSQTATNIKLTATGANVTLSSDASPSAASFSSTVTGGSVSSYADSVITWKFTYTVSGQSFETYAYTYVYAPFLGQTGAQGGYNYNSSALAAYAFLVGIHSTKGSTDSYRSLMVGTSTANKLCSPLIPGWGDSNVPSCDSDAKFTDGSTYFVKDTNGGISDAIRREYDTGTTRKTYGDYNAYGVLTIDSSRYKGQAFSAIPNFWAGWMIQRSKDCEKEHHLNKFEAADMAFITDNVSFSNGSSGQAFSGYQSSGTIPTADKKYDIDVSFTFRESGTWFTSHHTTYLDFKFGMQINIVDKAELRSLVSAEIKKNYQAFEFPENDAGLANHRAKLKEAATVLGKPDASATDITNAINALKAASLTIADYTATVTYKLPAANGFVYTTGEKSYTAADGFITITEKVGFKAGSDVTVTANTYAGFTPPSASSQTYSKRNSDISHTFEYAAKTRTVRFIYANSTLLPYVQNTGTSSVTVTYGQHYPAFPKPTMDGWKFDGWKMADGSANTMTETAFVDGFGDTVTLNGAWSCFFTGGHGTESDPFQIATTNDLDRIDDASAYTIKTDGSGTKDKYFLQTKDISYEKNASPVLTFDGIYEGDGKTLTIPSSIEVSGSTYGSIFGNVNGATIRNIKVNINGKFKTSGGSTSYSGIFGNVTSSTIDNIQVVFASTASVSGGTSGIMVGALSNGAVLKNSSVTVKGGTFTNAFAGTKASGATLSNTWTLFTADPTGTKTSNANNNMHVRENGTATVSYSEGRFRFNAEGSSGWSAEIRQRDDKAAAISKTGTWSPEATLNGADYYVCFVKNVTITAGEHGKVEGSGTYALRQGETVTGIKPNPSTADYQFTNWIYTSGLAGSMSQTSPYTFTMGTTGGTVTANFAENTYTLTYSGGVEGKYLDMPPAETHGATELVLIKAVPEELKGYTFTGWNTLADGTGITYLAGVRAKLSSGENITLYAQWQKQYYTVRFDAKGGASVSAMENKEYMTKVKFPTTTKTGYTGLVWHETDAPFSSTDIHYPNTDLTITENKTYYAEWTPITYNLVFVENPGDEGISNLPKPVTFTYDSGDFIIPASYVPVRPGYEFTGWKCAKNNTIYQVTDTVKGNLTATAGENILFYAQWKVATYKVTWNLNGGVIGTSNTNPVNNATYGGTYTLPESPRQLGKHFAGWFTTDDKPITATTTVSITENATFVAKWTNATYTLVFDPNGASGTMDNFVATCDTPFTLPEITYTRTGYTFTKWVLTEGEDVLEFVNGEDIYDNLTEEDGATLTLVAQWTNILYSIKYNSGALAKWPTMMGNTNQVTMNKTFTLRNFTAAATPVTIGDSTYSFYGWAFTREKADNMEVAYKNADNFTLTEAVMQNLELSGTTINLYAVWARHVTITWDLCGGQFGNDYTNPVTTVVYGQKFVLPNSGMAPTKFLDRYRFLGWADSQINGTEITNNTVLKSSEDMTVYACWEQVGSLESHYFIETYLMNPATRSYEGVTPSKSEGVGMIGDKATVTPQSITGYTFDTTAANILEGNITDEVTQQKLVLKLYYAVDVHFIKYHGNGETSGTMNNQEVAFQQTVQLAANTFKKTGYRFDGWSLSEGASKVNYIDEFEHFVGSTTDTDLYAVWTAIDYTISFQTEGGSTVTTISAHYGDTIEKPVDPTRSGYLFKGWTRDGVAFTIPETMPAESIVLKAVWEARVYTVSFDGNDGTGSMDSKSFTFGTTDVLPKNTFTKVGYTFGGWSTTIDGTATYADGASYTTGAGNAILYAVWTANTYIVEFVGGEQTTGTMASVRYNYNQEYALPENVFKKTGAEFVGWAKTAAGTGALLSDGAKVSNLTSVNGESVVLYAVWKNIDYVISFNGNGANVGTAPVSKKVNYNNVITIPDGSALAKNNEETKEICAFLGWVTEDGKKYSAGDSFTCPAADVTFTAVWSANYYELTQLVNTVKGYMDAQTLPASGTVDPDYAKGGTYAVAMSNDGIYSWDSFDTAALNTAYQNALKPTNRNLPEDQQFRVNELAGDIRAALNGLALLPVDYDYEFDCDRYAYGYENEYTGEFYPACEETFTHSYNGLVSKIRSILGENEASSMYTTASKNRLKLAVFGNGADIHGIVWTVENENLKCPSLEMLGEYVMEIAEAYHTTLELKGANYAYLDSLVTTYLPTLHGVEFGDVYSYYVSETVSDLMMCYSNINRDLKNIHQEMLDTEIYDELKSYIDALVPKDADYTELFSLIMTIPYGEGFSYPADTVNKSVYATWMEWAMANEGTLSEAVDAEYLNSLYTETSVAALNRALDQISFSLDIFGQNMISSTAGSMNYYGVLASAIQALETRTFTVTYMVNDGTEDTLAVYRGNRYGDKMVIPTTTPTRDGFDFIGWSYDAETMEAINAQDQIFGDVVIYALWEEVQVKPVEIDSAMNSTTVINTDKNYIYGLKAGITEAELLNDYLDVIGNGHIELEYTGFIGTGAKVHLVSDYTGEVLETYEIVIFGDLNGDGMINATDLAQVKGMVSGSVPNNLSSIMGYAANINGDSSINASDIVTMKSLLSGASTLDQATRTLS